MNIPHTIDKLRQFGVRVRLKGNLTDRVRILQAKCDAAGIACVLDCEVD